MSKIERIDEKLFETENFLVGQDWEVPIVGFFIISSIDNTKSKITDFSETELFELIGLQSKVRRLMEEVLEVKIVYFFQNEDTDHGFHIWCFPRLEWMEKFGRKIESVRPIINFAKENMWTDENMSLIKSACEKVRKNI